MIHQRFFPSRFFTLNFVPLLIVLAFFTTVASQAQARLPDGRSAEAVDSPSKEHEIFLGKVREGEEFRAKNPKIQPSTLEQVRKDFVRIQFIRVNIVNPAISSDKIDRKQLAKSFSEIKKLAVRLKNNLNLPASSKEKIPNESLPPDFTDRLKMLDLLIQNFVSNSIFQTKGVLDIQSAIKANQDLRQLIKISEVLKKTP